MRYAVIILGLMPCAVQAAPAAPLPDCATFIVGAWVGKGEVSFGGPQKVDNSWLYRRDHSFESKMRYRKQNGKWSESQLTKGTWEATKTDKPKICTIRVMTKGDGFEGESTSDIEILDANSFLTMGLTVKRRR